jgi:hypothetical protein
MELSWDQDKSFTVSSVMPSEFFAGWQFLLSSWLSFLHLVQQTVGQLPLNRFRLHLFVGLTMPGVTDAA